MTQLEKLSLVLPDSSWHTTKDLVPEVKHRFSAAIHIAVRKYSCKIKKRQGKDNQYKYRMLVAAKAVG